MNWDHECVRLDRERYRRVGFSDGRPLIVYKYEYIRIQFVNEAYIYRPPQTFLCMIEIRQTLRTDEYIQKHSIYEIPDYNQRAVL